MSVPPRCAVAFAALSIFFKIGDFLPKVHSKCTTIPALLCAESNRFQRSEFSERSRRSAIEDRTTSMQLQRRVKDKQRGGVCPDDCIGDRQTRKVPLTRASVRVRNDI